MYIKYQETPRTAFFLYIPINARLSGRYLLGKNLISLIVNHITKNELNVFNTVYTLSE
jgi:hypothetical protein